MSSTAARGPRTSTGRRPPLSCARVAGHRRRMLDHHLLPPGPFTTADARALGLTHDHLEVLLARRRGAAGAPRRLPTSRRAGDLRVTIGGRRTRDHARSRLLRPDGGVAARRRRLRLPRARDPPSPRVRGAAGARSHRTAAVRRRRARPCVVRRDGAGRYPGDNAAAYGARPGVQAAQARRSCGVGHVRAPARHHAGRPVAVPAAVPRSTRGRAAARAGASRGSHGRSPPASHGPGW